MLCLERLTPLSVAGVFFHCDGTCPGGRTALRTFMDAVHGPAAKLWGTRLRRVQE